MTSRRRSHFNHRHSHPMAILRWGRDPTWAGNAAATKGRVQIERNILIPPLGISDHRRSANGRKCVAQRRRRGQAGRIAKSVHFLRGRSGRSQFRRPQTAFGTGASEAQGTPIPRLVPVAFEFSTRGFKLEAWRRSAAAKPNNTRWVGINNGVVRNDAAIYDPTRCPLVCVPIPHAGLVECGS